MFDFAEATQSMTAAEILNYYRNLYYAEPQVTERGIVANAINELLPNVAPVVHGEWEFRNDGRYRQTRCYCSACGKHSGIGGIRENQKKPYCPNFGARMNGGKNGKE